MSDRNAARFEPLAVGTLRDRIADRIRRAIIDGELAPGERLIERRLAEQFGSGLSAVREALVELETRGLVVRRRNAATHVVQLDAGDVDKIFSVRRALEGLVIEEVTRRAGPEQIEELRGAYQRMRLVAENRDADRFQDEVITFHEQAWRMTGNDYLIDALERTVLPYFEDRRMQALSAASGPEDRLVEYFDRVVRSHLSILEAIETGDPSTARAVFDREFEGWYSRARDRDERPRRGPNSRATIRDGTVSTGPPDRRIGEESG